MRLSRRSFLKVTIVTTAAVVLPPVRIVVPGAPVVHMPQLYEVQETSPICRHPTIG